MMDPSWRVVITRKKTRRGSNLIRIVLKYFEIVLSSVFIGVFEMGVLVDLVSVISLVFQRQRLLY